MGVCVCVCVVIKFMFQSCFFSTIANGIFSFKILNFNFECFLKSVKNRNRKFLIDWFLSVWFIFSFYFLLV